MITTAAPAVKSVRAAQAGRALDLLSRAFAEDPMVRWAFPDEDRYREHFPQFACGFGARAFDHGTADRDAHFDGVALWLPPGVDPDESVLIAAFGAGAAPHRMQPITTLMGLMTCYHPREPHWYLPLMGVDPARQGRGVGSLLLQHAIERIDASGAAAYLESSNPRNVPLYQRFGFEVMGKIQAGDSPDLVPMVRPAR